MKQTLTVSVDEELVRRLREQSRVRKSQFRNKSHLVEEAIRLFLEEKDE